MIEGQIRDVAKRDIRNGEEMTFNYGYSLSNCREFWLESQRKRGVNSARV